MVDNSGSNARLIEADRDRHHRHTERERFECCVDARMGCKCPVSGMLRKPIFIIYTFPETVLTFGVDPH